MNGCTLNCIREHFRCACVGWGMLSWTSGNECFPRFGGGPGQMLKSSVPPVAFSVSTTLIHAAPRGTHSCASPVDPPNTDILHHTGGTHTYASPHGHYWNTSHVPTANACNLAALLAALWASERLPKSARSASLGHVTAALPAPTGSMCLRQAAPPHSSSRCYAAETRSSGACGATRRRPGGVPRRQVGS